MLNKKQMRFCELYLGECFGDPTAAAVKAGYSKSSARQIAYKLLHNEHVRNYLADVNKKVEDDTIAGIKDIQRFWTEIMNDESCKIADRLRASEALAKTKGMFNNDW